MLTADDGFKIAKKLGITPTEKRRHLSVVVQIEGQVIGRYGIRRGSGDLDHSFISKQIGLTPREARDLSMCPLTRVEYIALLRQRGRLTPPAST